MLRIELREISYHAGNRIGVIAYLQRGRDIYFSGMTSHDGAISTVNAAEFVVGAICAELHIDPLTRTFFDIQTHRGYVGKLPGYYVVSKLHLKNLSGIFSVESWEEVARWEYPRETDFSHKAIEMMDNKMRKQALQIGKEESAALPGIPADVFMKFRYLIEEKEE